MEHYCTYFDQNYLLRGLALYQSLAALGLDFKLHVLALDEQTGQAINAIPATNLQAIPLHALERENPELLIAKGNRSRIEYYFTLSPYLPLHILDRDPEIQRITYLDADLCFYASPAPVLAEMGDRSILVCEHRYSPYLKDMDKYGKFNVQFQSFRRDAVGLACLRRWRDQCLEWCHDYPDSGRYADQAYLDEWPQRYGDCLAVVAHKGAGLAPWNWAAFPLGLKDGTLEVAGQPLIFYHFHGLKVFSSWFVSNGLSDWGMMPWPLRRWLYANYVRKLRRARDWLHSSTGIAIDMHDTSARGKGIGLDSLGEVARKAWSQSMIIP